VVSGDFYWLAERKDRVFWVLADCTGHGVPGALLSMIGANLLDYLILQQKILKPERILFKFNIQFRKALRQQETRNDDGIDMGLCSWYPKENELQFAGANNRALYFQEKEMYEIESIRKSIGGRQKERLRTFKGQRVILEKPIMFYLYSDGFPDQNQTGTGEKFSKTRFKNLLQTVHHQPVAVQKLLLESTLLDWRGELPQRDDISVWGLKIIPRKLFD